MNVIPPHFRSFLKENRILASALVIFSVMPLLFSSMLGSWLLLNVDQVSNLMPEYGIWLVLASCLTMAIGLTPTTFVALASGFFLGEQGAAVLVFAYILASGFGYGLGRVLDGGHFMKSLLAFPVAEKIANDLREKPVAMLVLVRLSPALPFCLMNLMLAALRVNFGTYLLAGAAGMLPRTLLSLWIGNQSRDLVELLQSGGGQTETIVVLVGSVLTVALLVWMVMRRVKIYLRT
ncbi:VTT domain-containing protein [Parendozoicomonas sp. Alg238-R29]|uniref:TVP38/TMEM64 family protein n=1 Tax=Parendozoicomonas sp. Alg238-R29 TaxID=2993446 RepID=UPI00248DA1E7|nr:VTT domain-containing protein [Parendozoicomonas sp. Alg238-R29]